MGGNGTTVGLGALDLATVHLRCALGELRREHARLRWEGGALREQDRVFNAIEATLAVLGVLDRPERAEPPPGLDGNCEHGVEHTRYCIACAMKGRTMP